MAFWQLESLGVTREAVKVRLAARRLHRLYPGVYAVGHRNVSWRGRIMAAVLFHGPDAVASHRTAAALWDLLPARGNAVWVTVPSSGRAKCKGMVLKEVTTLHEKDRATRDGIPVTALARTLIDVFGEESEERRERALEQAERMRLLDGRALDEACDRAPTRKGVRAVRTRLRERREPAMSRSALERRFLIFCRKYGLPTPEMNPSVEGYEVDALWRRQKVVVELDDYYTHGTRASFESDRERDAKLQSLGYRTPRVTDKRLKAEPEAVADELRRVLSQP